MKRSLTIVAINDVYELTNFSRLKSLLRHVRETRTSPVLACLAGDFLAPSILSSMDKGLGVVECLNSLGISHVCFGNHEGDHGLEVLKKRIGEFRGTWLNSNVRSLPYDLPEYDVIECNGGGRAGVLGFISDEKGMFRGDRFRDHAIEPVGATATKLIDRLRLEHDVETIVPMTHQSMEYDIALAKKLRCPIILGGHDHEEYCEEVGPTTIVKAGQDAHTAVVIDLAWQSSDDEENVEKKIEFVPVHSYEPDEEMQRLVDSHMHVVKQLEGEIIVKHSSPLSSRNMRREQTSIGSVITSACKDELGVELVMINGGPIKGNRNYENGCVSYLELKEELPFPTKLITLDMPGFVIERAVAYSRRNAVRNRDDRGFLQLDSNAEVDSRTGKMLRIDDKDFDPDKMYSVAIPRNLFAGFCEIRPLMEFAESNEMPGSDNFWFTFNLVISHFSKSIWLNLGSFRELDLDGDGIIDRYEIKRAVREHTGREPSDVYVKNLMTALDFDNDGTITRQEFNRVVNAGYTISETWGDSFMSKVRR